MNTEKPIEIMRGEHVRFKLVADERSRYQRWPVQGAKRVSISDLREIDVHDLFGLGFANWDSHIMLVPLWSLGLIDVGERLVDINGRPATVGHDDIDTDTRGGCIAYGFEHPGLRELKDAAK